MCKGEDEVATRGPCGKLENEWGVERLVPVAETALFSGPKDRDRGVGQKTDEHR